MAVIKKKCWPKFFEGVLSGKKKFEVRLNDIEIKEGDTLILEEWDPAKKAYTGRTLEKKVTYAIHFSMAGLQKFWSKEELEKYGLRILSLE